MKIFLDTNIIVDSVIQRKNSETVEKILNLYGIDDLRFYMSTLTAPTVIYVTRHECSQKEALERLLTLQSRIAMLSVSGHDAYRALKGAYPDYEDGLQMLCAEEKGCDAIITTNKSHFQGYTYIPVFTPEEFLEACL